jgi:GntR family transcriptional regulator/MocR family aminotransferase
VAVEGVAPPRAAGGPPALVLGFARLPEHQIAEAVRLLAEAAATVPGTTARRAAAR